MKAVILGAGRGTRLGEHSNGLPKPLLQVGGTMLLDRQANLLRAAFPDLAAITVVVGFRSDVVRTVGGDRFAYVENHDYVTSNTAASLYLALLETTTETVVLNGDVFFDESAIRSLANAGDSAAICEFKSEVEPEEVQVKISPTNGIDRIGKNIGGVAEAVGIYRLSESLVDAYLNTYRHGDRWRYYEDLFDRLLTMGRVRLEPVSLNGGFAIEIDTPDDLARVEGGLAVAR